MLNKKETAFVLVDVQGKLSQIVYESEELLKNLNTLINSFRLLDIPTLWLEQYPKGLGKTTEELQEALTGLSPVEKMTFSACDTAAFTDQLDVLDRKQILIGGIESHICVYQTAMSLRNKNYEVEVVADAVSSRTKWNKEIGIEKMKMAGIPATSVEMALFEILKTAEHEHFKQISKWIK